MTIAFSLLSLAVIVESALSRRPLGWRTLVFAGGLVGALFVAVTSAGHLGRIVFIAQVKSRLPEYQAAVKGLLRAATARKVLSEPHADIAWADQIGGNDGPVMIRLAFKHSPRGPRLIWTAGSGVLPSNREPGMCLESLQQEWFWLVACKGRSYGAPPLR